MERTTRAREDECQVRSRSKSLQKELVSQTYSKGTKVKSIGGGTGRRSIKTSVTISMS